MISVATKYIARLARRKARMGFPSAGIGKSGGARVIYLYVPEQNCHLSRLELWKKVRRKPLPARKKTPSAKLQNKSEIRAALDGMEFSASALVEAAQGLAATLNGQNKVTLRSIEVSAPANLQPAEIAAIREKLNVSQAVFAAWLDVKRSSVMSWEYGTRRPSGAALKLLTIARKNPTVLIEA